LKDIQDRTALFIAVEQGSLACVKELIKRDDLQMNHNKGSVSAVMLAAQNGHDYIMQELLSLRSLDVSGAEEMARKNNHLGILAMLPGSLEHTQAKVAKMEETIRNLQMGGAARGLPVPECPVKKHDKQLLLCLGVFRADGTFQMSSNGLPMCQWPLRVRLLQAQHPNLPKMQRKDGRPCS